MGKKRRILFTAIMLGVLCGVAYWLIASSVPMPYYNGKSLTYWIEQFRQFGYGLRSEDPGKMQQARESIQKIGTNALPMLLRMTAADGNSALEKVKRDLNDLKITHLHLNTAFDDHWTSTFGFLALGQIVSPATPELIVLLRHKNPETREAAVRALGNIGPGAESAVPTLIKCLDDPEWGMRFYSAQALEQVGKKPEMVVPVLIQKLDESHRATNTFQSIMSVLEAYKDYPLTKTAVPRLIEFLTDSDYFCRSAATNALEKIDPAAGAKAGVK